MKNFIVFIDEEAKSSSRWEDTFDISLKGGKMCLNRFCIEEDVAFELSGVKYLKAANSNASLSGNYDRGIAINEQKGRENSLLWS